MSAEMWNAPVSRSMSFIAENTGRSGQPTQKPGGRAGIGAPSRSAAVLLRCGEALEHCFGCRRVSRPRGRGQSRGNARRRSARPRRCIPPPAAARPCRHLGVVDFGPAQHGEHRILEVGGLAFLDDQHRALAGAELDDLLGDQRIGDVEAVDGDLGPPKQSESPSCCSARMVALYRPPWQMMPISPIRPAKNSFSSCSRMNFTAAGKRTSILCFSCA